MRSLLSRKRTSWFEHIAESISSIQTYVDGMPFETFVADDKTRAAVERKLQIISEAAIRLKDHAAEACPEIDWADVRGMGNWLRHQYEHVNVETLWKTIHENLPAMAVAVNSAIKQEDSK